MAFLLRKIAKNDAMKSDPVEVYNWRVYLLAGASCFGAMSFGWDSSVIGGVINLDTFKDDHGLLGDKVAVANLSGNIVSALQPGCFFGALAAFPLADILGRKWCLAWAAVTIIAGVIMQAAASGHLEALYIGRLIAGFGVGGASVVNPLFMRISPPPVDSTSSLTPQGYVAIVAIFVFAAFFQFGWDPACWIYASETPTACLQPMNVALAAATQWLFNFVVSRAVPNMLATVGEQGYGTYLIFGSFGVIMFIFVISLVPQAKGISLERMDELFGGAAADHDGKIPADEEKADASVETHQVHEAGFATK